MAFDLTTRRNDALAACRGVADWIKENRTDIGGWLWYAINPMEISVDYVDYSNYQAVEAKLTVSVVEQYPQG